jgi:hypothetical protein
MPAREPISNEVPARRNGGRSRSFTVSAASVLQSRMANKARRRAGVLPAIGAAGVFRNPRVAYLIHSLVVMS